MHLKKQKQISDHFPNAVSIELQDYGTARGIFLNIAASGWTIAGEEHVEDSVEDIVEMVEDFCRKNPCAKESMKRMGYFE